jgi:hypothetical protein
MSLTELQRVKNFEISNTNGLIKYDEVDLSGLNLAKEVKIDKYSVTVHPDTDHRPKLGEKLNRPA